MRKLKLKSYMIGIAGVCVCAIAGAYIYYEMIAPTEDLRKAAKAKYEANYPDSTLTAMSAAKKQRADAARMVAIAQARWDEKQRALMPPWDVSDRDKAWKQETLELTKTLGESVLKWVPRTGVVMTNAVNLPAPPVSPNLVTGAPKVINLGGFTVLGDFRQILSHVLKWNDFSRLVMIDGLALHGNSPQMRGTYTLTVFEFPQNGDKIGPLIPKAGGGGGGSVGSRPGPPPGFGGASFGG